MKQKSIKGNLLKNCKVHYEKKNRFQPSIFDTKLFMIYEKKKIQGNLLKNCKVIFEKKNKQKTKKHFILSSLIQNYFQMKLWNRYKVILPIKQELNE